MIRNTYRVDLGSLYFLLMNSRLNTRPFRPMPSRRESNQAWEKRRQTNNKHTMGSEA